MFLFFRRNSLQLFLIVQKEDSFSIISKLYSVGIFSYTPMFCYSLNFEVVQNIFLWIYNYDDFTHIIYRLYLVKNILFFRLGSWTSNCDQNPLDKSKCSFISDAIKISNVNLRTSFLLKMQFVFQTKLKWKAVLSVSVIICWGIRFKILCLE